MYVYIFSQGIGKCVIDDSIIQREQVSVLKFLKFHKCSFSHDSTLVTPSVGMQSETVHVQQTFLPQVAQAL